MIIECDRAKGRHSVFQGVTSERAQHSVQSFADVIAMTGRMNINLELVLEGVKLRRLTQSVKVENVAKNIIYIVRNER